MGDQIQHQLAQLVNLFQEERAANIARQEAINARLDALTKDLANSKVDSESTDHTSQNRGWKGKSGVAEGSKLDAGGSSFIPRYTKLDFPWFTGQGDPLGWLNRCDHFFRHQQTPDEEKVGLASFHLEGNAQLWFLQLETDLPEPSWDEFKRYCNLRFGPPIRSQKLGELAKLRQIGSVADYQEKFEQVVSRAGTLTQSQKIELYISGLVDCIAIEVELHNPLDLATAMSLSRLYERKGQPFRSQLLDGRRSKTSDFSPPQRTRFVRKLTRSEMDERRLKGLCFNCDEVFTRGHLCKKLFWIDSIDEEEESLEQETNPNIDQPEISLQAIIGVTAPQNMRLQGQLAGNPVVSLVDSGSTHSFVNSKIVSQFNLQVERREGLRVVVVNGERVRSPGQCEGVSIWFGNHAFHIDLYVLNLSGFDVVLGVNWLKTLGPILWDFTDMWMSFFKNGKQVELQGVKSPDPTQGATTHVMLADKDNQEELQIILKDFACLFNEPVGLPAKRDCDHKIVLEPGTKPVVVRPYRYPHNQKDEIERQCSEMLKQGIIRPSQSPFSSPVLLVPKSDGSWRMCIDYRELNAKTIKDKFPIPIIEELLEELFGAKYFSKLDLRQGYYQVRMKEDDVEKTGFRTHHGHFEFLVMPFGLTNAPSTFQSLVKEVFQLHLRKFILVFFDDILVYSRTWVEHMYHLRLVFKLLSDHHLFLKQSKCSFAQTEIAYLGHLITADGVSADSSKISAMTEWSKPTTLKGLRGFLGLTGYYRKFVENYGSIAEPLTAMLRKNSFIWTDQSTQAFKKLKVAMTTTPVLALPDFSQPFVIECDASDLGIGAVLLQNKQPIAFFSRVLARRHQPLPAYEKELIGLVKAIRQWRSYLWGQHFIVRTDHYSLKFLLEQKALTPPQQHWLAKILGYSFSVEYKAGRLNTVADALSRRDNDEAMLLAISMPQLSLFDDIRNEQQNSPDVQQLISDVHDGTASDQWSVKNGLLLYKHRTFLASNSPSIQTVMTALHNQGHEGYQKSLFQITRDFQPQMLSPVHLLPLLRMCATCSSLTNCNKN
ncbi:uncharacterized protein [Solanum tuberosum]|uniref:uncharacterized protein n=1 Tax=Solanum tuberosum TaxID=4113 RepID=UPI0003D283AB|nr:PREDICTED: uncharacterized protein LOC102604101 [Solanum tuberosum]